MKSGLIHHLNETNQELCSETFRTWLSDPVKRAPEGQKIQTLVKWLLVFDNAEEPEVIKKFWPCGPHGSILLTVSRSAFDSQLIYNGTMRLEGLPTADGALLLRHCAQDNNLDDLRTEADSMAIVEWVQGLPLAVEQLGRIIYHNHLSISRFRETHQTKRALDTGLYKRDNDYDVLVTT